MPTQSKTKAVESPKPARFRNPFKAEPRHWVAEWSVTILILLFATSTLLQAFVVPSGSMENSLLIGDHLFVDKLAYSPYGSFSKHLLPYQEVTRGDVIVFRYPVDINKDYVKRVIGVPGDRLHLKDGVLVLNGHAVPEPYVIHSRPGTYDEYRDNFPQGQSRVMLYPSGRQMLENGAVGRGHRRAGGLLLRDGRQPRELGRQPLLGLRAAREHQGQAGGGLVELRCPPPTSSPSGNIDLGHLADIAVNFFTKTRWNRTFHFIRSYPLQ